MNRDRDPRIDPRQGDVVAKDGQRNVPIRRLVAGRDGNQVFYRSAENGVVKACWLSTWMDWCYGAEVGGGKPRRRRRKGGLHSG
jgi:hypothetical protein